MPFLLITLFLIAAAAATWKAPRLTCAVLWSLISTLFATAALLLILPGAFSTKTFWIVLSVPVIWVSFQFYSYYADSPWRVVATQLGVTLVSAGVVFLCDPKV